MQSENSRQALRALVRKEYTSPGKLKVIPSGKPFHNMMEKLSDRNRVPVLQQTWKNTLGQSEHRQSILQHCSLPRLDWEQLHS